MPLSKLIARTVFLVVFLSGCSALTSSGRITADAAAHWAVLPLNNLSSTPLAGNIAATLVETRLRARGVERLSYYQPPEQLTLASIVSPANAEAEAVDWARAKGMRYVLSGTVHEWRYKNGSDKEPVAGISLKLTDLTSGAVLWQASDARSGWGFASLSAIGDALIKRLLKNLDIQSLSNPATVTAGY